MMPNKSRSVAVIGLGTFGVSVAEELARMGDTVLGIDSNETLVQNLNHDIANTLQADATDPRALAECGLDAYEAVVISIGENIEASILTAMNVIDLNCPKVWVKAQNETQKRILQAIGVHHVVLPEQAYGRSVAQIIHNPAVQDFLSLGDDNFVVRIKVPGSKATELVSDPSILENHNLICLGLYQGEEVMVLGPTLKVSDSEASLLLSGKRADLRKFADKL